MIYRDREEAGVLLARALASLKGKHPLVLAIPRGAVPMGRLVADALEGELDVVLVRKLGAPGAPELAIGAVDESGETYLQEMPGLLGIQRRYIEEERARQLALLRQRRALYTPGRAPVSAADRIVVVLDDGVATGSTMIAALRAVRRAGPRELIAAAAVMPPDTLERLEREADRVVCLDTPEEFVAVSQFFEDFAQVTDAEVAAALAAAGAPAKPEGSPSAPAPAGRGTVAG